MDGRGGHGGQLRYPAPHVVTVGVEAPALRDRVEDPEERLGIGARPRGPLPSAVVAGHVAVDQVGKEVRLATAPVDQQVLAQE